DIGIRAEGMGCDSLNWVFSWYELNGGTLVGNGANQRFAPGESTTYRVVLRDTVGHVADSAEIQVVVDDLYELYSSLDTLVCYGEQVPLRSWILSCDTQGIQYTWSREEDPGQILASQAEWMSIPV